MKTVYINKKGNRYYYLTSLTEQQRNMLYEAKTNGTLTECSVNFGIDCNGITLIGKVETAKVSSINSFVGSFDGKNLGEGRELHYRSYSKSEEKQKETSWLINLCVDSNSSAASAFAQMDEEYCCFWEVHKDNPYNKNMLELLGKDLWKIKH